MLMHAAKAAHVAVDGQQSALASRYVTSSKYIRQTGPVFQDHVGSMPCSSHLRSTGMFPDDCVSRTEARNSGTHHTDRWVSSTHLQRGMLSPPMLTFDAAVRSPGFTSWSFDSRWCGA